MDPKGEREKICTSCRNITWVGKNLSFAGFLRLLLPPSSPFFSWQDPSINIMLLPTTTNTFCLLAFVDWLTSTPLPSMPCISNLFFPTRVHFFFWILATGRWAQARGEPSKGGREGLIERNSHRRDILPEMFPYVRSGPIRRTVLQGEGGWQNCLFKI